MSFVWLPDDPTDADFFDDGEGCCSVVVRLGYDDETHTLYSLCAGTAPGAEDALEYYFCLLAHDPSSGETRHFFDALDVAQIVGREHRPFMLASYIEATRTLLDRTEPTSFAMMTFNQNLPDKALEKYHRINTLFTECGYSVTECEPVEGCRLWLVERAP